MLAVQDMRPGRFARWARARALVARIRSHLAAGGRVVLGTHTRATEYGPAHAEWFKATRTGAYVRRGKAWDCIDYAGFRFSALPLCPARPGEACGAADHDDE